MVEWDNDGITAKLARIHYDDGPPAGCQLEIDEQRM